MKLLCYLIITMSIGMGQYTHQTYVIPTEPASELASRCPDNGNMTESRCLTLNQLIISVPNGQSAFEPQEEVVFQSGIHVVNGTERQNLTALRIRNLTMRGEPGNVTITCLEEFFFRFEESYHISIFNIKFDNCSGWSNANYTISFNKQIGNVVLDQIQVTNRQGAGVAVHMKGDHRFFPKRYPLQVHLTNSKIFTGKIGIYVGYYRLFVGSHSSVYIENTSFVGSCIEFQAQDRFLDDYNIVLKSISIENCTCWSTLALRGANNIEFNIMLYKVEMRDNKSPYLVYANQTSLIHVTGSNSFHRNQGVVYLSRSKLVFSVAKVEFVNNTVLTAHGVPILATKSQIVFENSHISFINNHGIHCGGIIAKLQTYLIFKDNSSVDFTHNSGEKDSS